MSWKICKPLLVFLIALSFSPVWAEDVLVTGNPASPEFLREVLTERGWRTFPSRALHPGESWKGSDGRRVINLDWTPPSPHIVALSDHPEKVERRGGLFLGGLTTYRPLLFQYYHLGLLKGANPNLSFILTNPGTEPATLHLQKGIGRTSLDYFSSGHTNNVRWFETTKANLGQFVTIPAGETIELFRQPLPIDEVVSGLLGLTQTEGPPLSFAFVARPDGEERVSLNNLLKEGDTHSRGFYPAPRQLVKREFLSGASPLNIAVGAVRQPTFWGVRELRGDYGVTYDLQIDLRNQESTPSTIEFVFNPRGGAATATFLIDEELVEIPIIKAFEERVFHRVVLQPGAERKVRLLTIPEGASSYPVRVIVRKASV